MSNYEYPLSDQPQTITFAAFTYSPIECYTLTYTNTIPSACLTVTEGIPNWNLLVSGCAVGVYSITIKGVLSNPGAS